MGTGPLTDKLTLQPTNNLPKSKNQYYGIKVCNTCPRFRVVPCRLLQRGFRRAPKTITDRLQRVLNAAARVVSDTRKFDRGLLRIMHTELHWLDVPERINYKLSMLMYRCQHNKAPRYLMDHCTSVSDVAYRQRLRSISSHEVSVPRHRLSTYGRRAFAVAGPTVWNSLPDDMRDPDVSEDSYSLQAVTEDVFIFAVLVCSAH